MKINKLKTLIGIVILIIAPFLLEAFRASWNVTVLHGSDQGVTNIDLDSKHMKIKEGTDKNGEFERTYFIKNINQYTNKLVLSFKAKENNQFDLAVVGKNSFGTKEKSNKEVSLIKGMNCTTQYFNKEINRMEITVHSKDIYLKNISIKNTIEFNWGYFSFFASISFFIGVCYYLFKNNKFQLEWIFLVLVMMIGCLSIGCFPKVSHWSPDSEIHFKNSYIFSFLGSRYNITNSFDKAIELPSISMPNTIEDEKALSAILNEQENNIPIYQNEKPLFPGITQWGYLPYSVGLRMGRIIHLPFTYTFMLAKLCTLIFYAVMCFFAIKIAKKGKRLFFVLSLIPSMIFLVTQFSLDGIIFSSLLLAFSLFTSLYFDKDKKVSFGWTLAFILSVIFGSLPKSIFGVIILLPLLFKKDKFINKKQCKLFKTGIILIFIMLLIVIVLPILSNSSGPSDLRGGETNPIGQITSLITHPLAFFTLFKNAALQSISFGFLSFENLGHYFYVGIAPAYLMLIFQFLLFFLALSDWEIDEEIPILHRIFKLALLMLMIFMIYGALYVSFTPVGLNQINGVQPRYFLPLLPLFFLLFANTKIKHSYNETTLDIVVVSIASIISFMCIFLMIITIFCN